MQPQKQRDYVIHRAKESQIVMVRRRLLTPPSLALSHVLDRQQKLTQHKCICSTRLHQRSMRCYGGSLSVMEGSRRSLARQSCTAALMLYGSHVHEVGVRTVWDAAEGLDVVIVSHDIRLHPLEPPATG